MKVTVKAVEAIHEDLVLWRRSLSLDSRRQNELGRGLWMEFTESIRDSIHQLLRMPRNRRGYPVGWIDFPPHYMAAIEVRKPKRFLFWIISVEVIVGELNFSPELDRPAN